MSSNLQPFMTTIDSWLRTEEIQTFKMQTGSVVVIQITDSSNSFSLYTFLLIDSLVI